MKEAALILMLAGLGMPAWADPMLQSSLAVTKETAMSSEAKATVSLSQAVKTAEKKTGKKAFSATLTTQWHDDKSGFLIYDIDTVGEKKEAVTAVFVDPVNGKVLATQDEDWTGVGEEKEDSAKPADQKESGWKVTGFIPLGGEESWDFLATDPDRRRLFVSHGSQVEVLDLDSHALLTTLT